jgi:hypothetical protein
MEKDKPSIIWSKNDNTFYILQFESVEYKSLKRYSAG